MLQNLLSAGATPSVLEKAVLFVVAFWLVRKEIRSLFKVVYTLLKDLHARLLVVERAQGIAPTKASEELWKDV